MQLIPDSAPAGAFCALHAQVAADSVCSRCGGFMCSECSQRRSGLLCQACREVLGTFPFKRDDYDFGRVWNLVFDSWRRDIVMLGVAGLVFLGLGMVGNMVAQLLLIPIQVFVTTSKRSDSVAGIVLVVAAAVVGYGIGIITQGIGMLGFIRICFDCLHAKKIEIPRMFSQARKLGSFIVIQLGVIAVAVVPAVLAGFIFYQFRGVGPEPLWIGAIVLTGIVTLVAVIYVATPLALASYELVYSGCGAGEALRRAWLLGDGHRGPIMGYTLVALLMAMALTVAGVLALCIGVFVALPIAYAFLFLTQAALFLSLRTGSDLPLPEEH